MYPTNIGDDDDNYNDNDGLFTILLGKILSKYLVDINTRTILIGTIKIKTNELSSNETLYYLQQLGCPIILLGGVNRQ